MNIKKSFLVALAGATAFATMSSFAVSAVEDTVAPGDSDSTSTVEIEVVDGQAATGEVTVEGDITVSVEIPADAVEAGIINFNAAVKVDLQAEAAIASVDNVNAFEVLDLYFTNQDGEVVDMTGKNVVVTIKNTTYNTVYHFGESLELIESSLVGTDLTFTAPHFPTFVLADVSKGTTNNDNNGGATNNGTTDNNNGTTDNNNGTTGNGTTNNGAATQTGDNGFTTTIVIFSIMAVISLATAVVATKVKKSSK